MRRKEAYNPTQEEMEAYRAKSTGLKDWQVRQAIRKERNDRKMSAKIPFAESGSYIEPEPEPGDAIDQAFSDVMEQEIFEEKERLVEKFGKKNF